MRIVAPLEGWLWLPALLCAAHWAALGTFVQATAWPLASKWLALTCLGWWIPALLQGAPEWDRLRWTLSPERHFQAGISPIETSSGALVDTIPLVAWWVAAALVPTRSAFKR
jgi:hypothetical protein